MSTIVGIESLPQGPRSARDPVRPPVPGEFELKLFVPPSSIAGLWTHPSIVDHAVGPLRIARVENRYFDTPERDLAGHRMALRLRRVAGRWVQTLKLAGAHEGALSLRGEWEMPVAGPALELARLRDTPLATLAAPRTLARRLQPVFATNFRRESRMLRLRDGTDVEFAFDVGVITTGRGQARRSLPICEVEIEWKPGDAGAAEPPDLMRFAARLARDIALIPLAASKAARGYRLADRKSLEPAKVDLPVPLREHTPEAHLGRVLGACNRALLVNVHALIEVTTSDDIDPLGGVDTGVEFLHQARVAIRRMRSALLTFRPVAKGRRFEALDEGLRSAGKRFGLARDWDVFVTTTMGRLEEEVGGDDEGRDALVALRVEAERMRANAHRALAHYVDTGDFGTTAIAIERMVARLAADAKDHGPPLAAAGAKWLAAQRGRIVPRSRRIAVLDDEERHALRIEVKRMRYALDLLDALYDREAVGDYRDALAALQDKLGTLNDATVADALMQTLPPTPSLELVQSRFRAWLHRHVRKQLPKVAALSVAFELAPQPWRAGHGDA